MRYVPSSAEVATALAGARFASSATSRAPPRPCAVARSVTFPERITGSKHAGVAPGTTSHTCPPPHPVCAVGLHTTFSSPPPQAVARTSAASAETFPLWDMSPPSRSRSGSGPHGRGTGHTYSVGSAHRGEPPLEVGDEVCHVLDAARDADEAVGDAERLARLLRH